MRFTLILAGLIVGRWWMLIVGPAVSIAFFIYRCRLILPGPGFFVVLALTGAVHVGIGLLLRKAGQAVWRMMVAAWMRFAWPRLGDGARTFLTILRPPLRVSIIANVAWPLLFFGLYFFLHPPRRGMTPIPTMPLEVVTFALGGAIGAWAGYRVTTRGAGGLWRAVLGALTVVLATHAAIELLLLPITALFYFLDPNADGMAVQRLQQLARDSGVTSAGGVIGGLVGSRRPINSPT